METSCSESAEGILQAHVTVANRSLAEGDPQYSVSEVLTVTYVGFCQATWQTDILGNN